MITAQRTESLTTVEEPAEEVLDLSLAGNSMSYLLVCGITLFIAALAFHIWSRLLWLICGACFGAFFGFAMGKRYSVSALTGGYSAELVEDAEAKGGSGDSSGPSSFGSE